MNTIWKLQDAKAQFSKPVKEALKNGPQVVTRRGAAAVVIVSAKEYEALEPEFMKIRRNKAKRFFRALF